jgi:transcriptional regulator with XRE-family HTH domain
MIWPMLLSELGDAVLTKRRERGLNVRQAGEEIGVSYSVVSRVERGKAQPDVLGFLRILRWLDIGVTEFLEPSDMAGVPGWGGSAGPGPDEYDEIHVYARSVYSADGRCVCRRHLGDPVHAAAAPGVPVPARLRA